MPSKGIKRTFSDADQETAWKAAKRFRALVPQLEAFAQAATGRPVKVVPRSTQGSATDGLKVYMSPPFEMGYDLPHSVNQCDRLDGNGYQICRACAVREEILVNLYHEFSHILFGTFEHNPDRVSWSGLRRFGIVRPAFFSTDSIYKESGKIDPKLQPLMNALEDVRVDLAMYRTRPGLERMGLVSDRSIAEGMRIDPAGKPYRLAEQPLDAQAITSVYYHGKYGAIPEGTYDPKVHALYRDKILLNLVEGSTRTTNAVETFELSCKILFRLRELGFLHNEQTFTPPPPLPSKPPQDEEEQEDESNRGEPDPGGKGEGKPEPGSPEASADPEPARGGAETEGSDGRGDASVSDGRPAPERSDSRGEVPPEGGEEAGEQSEGEGGNGDPGEDPLDAADGDASDTAGEADPGGDSGSSGGSDQATVSDDADSDRGFDDDLGSGDAAESDVPGDDQRSDAAAADTDPQSGDATGDDEPADTESGAGPERHDGDDGTPEEGGSNRSSGDSGHSRPDLGSAAVRPATGNTSTGGATVPSPGPDAPTGDLGPAMGTPPDPGPASWTEYLEQHGDDGDLRIAVELVTGHREHLDEPGEKALVIQIAIQQSDNFEQRSVGLTGVLEYRPTDGDWMINDAWASDQQDALQRMDRYSEPSPSVLSNALMRLRKALEDNRRAKFDRGRKSGRVNKRSLGRRAWSGDERLFQKKEVEAKKDYAVIVGLDISGSTGIPGRLENTKIAVMAQCELLSRLGIPFKVVAHTGVDMDYHWNGSFFVDEDTPKSGLYLTTLIVKDWDEPWGKVQKDMLWKLFPTEANLDGHALEYLRKQIEKRNEQGKLIMYYSDGSMPLENFDEELEILLREMAYLKRHNIGLAAVGISNNEPQEKYGIPMVLFESEADILAVVDHVAVSLGVR